MSASPTIARRRGSASFIIAAIVASLIAVPLAAQGADAATPKCFGKKATIVGTAGDDVLKGTRKNDVIVGLGGDDVIRGGKGKDRICGRGGADDINGGGGSDKINAGWGSDRVRGYYGDDRIFGKQGNDVLLGNGGNDAIDGGAGTDRCVQGSGSGSVKGCETADLAVAVSSPKNSTSPDVTFTVTVTNNGPSAVSYTLNLDHSSQKATCDPVGWEGNHAGAVLASGATRDHVVQSTCTKNGGGAKSIVDASVSSVAPDPDGTNDSAQGKTNLK